MAFSSIAFVGQVYVHTGYKNFGILKNQDGNKNRLFVKGLRCSIEKRKFDKNYALNLKLISATSLDDILGIVGNELENQGRLKNKVFMTPVNVSTALHRIARQMEKMNMSKSTRLAIGRSEEVRKLVSEAMNVLPYCESRSLSNIIWSLSKIGNSSLYSSELDLISKFLISNKGNLLPQHISNISSSFATALHSSPLLLSHLAKRACSVIHVFNPQELSQFLWAFAVLSHPMPSVFDQIDNLISESDSKNNRESQSQNQSQSSETIAWSNLTSWSERQLSNLAWAYSIFNQTKRKSFQIFLKEINSRDYSTSDGIDVRDRRMTERHLSQLHQVQMTLDLENSDAGLTLEHSLRQRAEASWKEETCSPKVQSVFEKDVERLLAGSEYDWVSEYFNGYYSLDFSVPDFRFGIELDGPSHFTRNTSFPLGSTIIKHRHLAMANWKVISIPFFEWDELSGEPKQREYLEEKISLMKK